MPQTRFQGIIFALFNSFLMSYFMVVYNLSINSINGLTSHIFIVALSGLYKRLIVAFLFAYFIASPIAIKSTFKILNPKKDNKIFITLFIQTFTVLIMVGLMSLFTIISFHLINDNVLCTFITLYCKNFIMAYPLQIFLVGPFVRRIFSFLFSKNIN